ncbi:histidine kinase [Candidatus Chloroploca sp. Khr17]|uniref:histidine kinase n=1 Tax=Candidatus Chloroploca sp. Khr17 TaxID=2496869 RepID=UPI0013EA9D10|nr:histidine kinase [Candidatus Chloroploca sp. Khr17]
MTPEPGLASDPHGRLSVALAVCAQRLAADPVGAVEEREVLAEVLVTLRESAGALRAVLYENITLPTVGPAARLLVEVWAPSERSLTEIYGLERTLIWSKMTDADRMAMAAGEPIGGSIAQRFADAPLMCADLDELGIGTLHMFPIMFSGQWWGHLGLSHREPQSWRDSEVQLMRAAAAMIGMFLQRNREVAALRAREAMLEGLSDSLPDAFLYQIEEQPDGTSRRTYLSRSLEQRSGISVDLALHDFDLLPTRMHPDDVSAYEAAKQYAQKNNTPYKFEHRYTTTDGSIRWMRWHSSPRVTSDGRRLWSGLATDITDYQQLQESLRQANQNLRRRIDQLVLFNQIAQHLGGMTNTSTTLSVVCRLICAMFNASEVLVALRDLPARDLKMVARAAAMDVDDLLSPTMLARIEASLGADNGVTWVEGPTPPGYVVLAVALAAQDMPIGLLLICVAQADAHLSGEIISLAQTVAGAIAGAAVGAQLYVRAVQSRERLERLNAASRMINESGLDPQALYGAIHCAVAHLMPVEAFVITLVEAGSAVAETVYAYDLAGLEQGTYRFGLEQSFVGYMRQHGSTLRVDDFRQFYQQHPEVKFHVYGDEQDTRSAVAASLRTSDGVYGILFSQCYLPGVYSDEDLTILELLSVHAATAIQNVRRAQQRRRDAIDEERSRLARDLHDSVNQSLFSASLIAERLPEMMQLSPDDANEGLRQLHQLTRSALAEMRALLIELRPAALAAAPLHQAINHLAQAFGGRRGITIKTELDPAPVLPPEVQIALYRIVQESLSNVIKHAYARTAHVRMEVTPLVGDSEVSWSGTIDIQVRDNGRGFAIDQVGVGRFGLEIMRERATAIGAELELLSQTGVGTQVTLIWCGSAGVA